MSQNRPVRDGMPQTTEPLDKMEEKVRLALAEVLAEAQANIPALIVTHPVPTVRPVPRPYEFD